MKIKLSRHARNNMRLYGILAVDVMKAIQEPDQHEKESLKIIVLKKFQNRFSGFPLKVVYQKKDEEIFIITSYPLKKSYRGHKL